MNTVASNYDELHDIFNNIIVRPTMDDETIRLAEEPDVSHRAKRWLLNPRQAYRALYDAIHDSMLTQITQCFQHLDRLGFSKLLDEAKF